MDMTHYMQLLADNQPWNLLLFMAIPVVLAETVAVTELFILLRRPSVGTLVTVNRAAGIAAGAYFVGVFVYLMGHAVVPITQAGQWRGPADVIAVGFYLAGVLPLGAIALIDLRWLGARWGTEARLAAHALAVATFLVVAHIAMIFGMLDPAVLGASSPPHMGH